MKHSAVVLNLGQYLKIQRERKNMTQADLAKSIRIKNPQSISSWERNQKTPPKRHLKALVTQLELNVELMADLLLQKPRAKIIKDLRDFDKET